jgi:hypothetical protein
MEASSVSEAVSIELPLKPASASRARESLRGFRDRIDPDAFVDLQLLASELLVEALAAEEEPEGLSVQLQAEMDGEVVRLEMTQGERAYRLHSRAPEPGEPGWALHLVGRLAERWGFRRERDRATVWLELRSRALDA